jgi:hypothetical protein
LAAIIDTKTVQTTTALAEFIRIQRLFITHLPHRPRPDLFIADLYGVLVTALLTCLSLPFTLDPQRAENLDKLQTMSEEMEVATITQRRCILLALVGATDENSPSLSQLLSNGYLSHVKLWLDDILSGSKGEFCIFV